MENNKTHVAIVASSGMGHVIPSIELAKRLVSLHGVEVSLFIPSMEVSSTQNQLLRSLILPAGLLFVNLPPVDVTSDAGTDIPTLLSTIVRKSIPSIQSAIQNSPRPPPKHLIVDIFAVDAFEIAGPLNMSKYFFFPSNATTFAFMAYLPKLDKEITCDYQELTESIRVPGCKPLRVTDTGNLFQDRKSQGYNCVLRHARRLAEISGILVNTCEELEPLTLGALKQEAILRQFPIPRVHPVGPITKSAAPPKISESECLTWLDMQPSDSVLFVSFGSGGTLSAKQITELAWGLELSQQRFLWVVKPPQDKVVTSDTYLNSGSGNKPDPSKYLPDGFLIRTREMGLVVSTWAPQVEILAHSSIGGFLSHCGWNSTLESLVHGVPMVAWPLHAEQNTNAWMLTEELGVAVRSSSSNSVPEKKAVVGREEIERLVRLVMDEGKEGTALRNRVKEVKERILRSLEVGGSSYESLSELAKSWKENES